MPLKLSTLVTSPWYIDICGARGVQAGWSPRFAALANWSMRFLDATAASLCVGGLAEADELWCFGGADRRRHRIDHVGAVNLDVADLDFHDVTRLKGRMRHTRDRHRLRRAQRVEQHRVRRVLGLVLVGDVRKRQALSDPPIIAQDVSTTGRVVVERFRADRVLRTRRLAGDNDVVERLLVRKL